MALNGTINSLVNGQTGGSVFFYSPKRFVPTGTSIINVGSLVLSASPITVTVDGNGNSFINNGSVVPSGTQSQRGDQHRVGCRGDGTN